MRYLVFMLWLSLFSMPLSAQLYKWVDENGKTQYSDQPPPSVNVKNEQKLKIHSAPASVSSSNSEDKDNADRPNTLAEERLEYDQRRQERLEKKTQQKAKAEEDKQKCVDAQSKLRVFSESPRLRMPDGNGGLVYVDDNVRQQKINEANDAVKTFCK
ncbi:MAG: DUF4124 domain-containing protein [Burkholderiales bacterium]|nr:DUF4124 domain-containing protein [Burkholderiales bacterium]MDR4518670.1 DUF4124 domain-containing protein [Nitrosomonas sp.]